MRKILLLALLVSAQSFAAFKGDLKADTAATLKMCIALSADAEPATALDIDQADVRVSKNGGNMAQKNDATANAAHDEIGCYDITIDATDTNTEGRIDFCVDEALTIRQCDSYMVLNASYFDMKHAAGSAAVLSSRDTGLVLGPVAITTVTSQTVLILPSGASNDDAYPAGATVSILSGTEECETTVADYVGSTTTLHLLAACPFTVVAGDLLRIRIGASGPGMQQANDNLNIITGVDGVTIETSGINDGAIDASQTELASAAALAVLDVNVDELEAATILASGTCDSGTTATCVDAALTQANDYWKGKGIVFSTGETSCVYDFVAGDDTLHFWTIITDIGTETYNIVVDLSCFTAIDELP